MKHLLLSVAFLLCAGLAFAAGAPGPGEEMAAPSTAQAPASRELPLRNEEEYTAQLNAQLQAAQEDRERRRERSRWVAVVTLSGLVIAFVALAGWALRSRQPRAVRLSRLALWTPCLPLASAWFFPWSLYAAAAGVAALVVVWGKRALPWWELGVATALYLPALVVTWLVFKTLAGMGAG